MTTIRMFLTPGGFAAALTCLVLTACGQPGSMDSGMMPMPDAGPMMGDGGPDQPDAYVPPDHDSGMPDVDAGTDGGDMGTCTAEMMLSRVTPPCEPDLPSAIPLATAQAATDFPEACRTTFNAHTWGGTGFHGCSTYLAMSPMDLIEVGLGCDGIALVPFDGVFHYGASNTFYANRKNADTQTSAELHVEAGCATGMVSIYDPGATSPSRTIAVWME